MLEILALAALGVACEDSPGLTTLVARGAFEPGVVDFGEVTVGSVKSVPVIFRNTGDLPLSIEDVQIPEDFSLRGLKVQLQSLDLPPGGTVEFEVVFLPRAEGPRREMLSLIATEVSIELELRGIGTLRRLAQLTLEPSAVDFGRLTIGSTDRRTVTVRNAGTADAELRAARLASTQLDATSGTLYALDTNLPVVVPAGGTASLVVRFTPSAEATFTDTILLDAGLPLALELGLRGEGQTARGGLECTPPSLDFGPVQRGDTSLRTVMCRATGGPVRVLRTTSSSPMQFTVPMPADGFDLGNGDSVDVQVVFESRGALGSRTAQLTVEFQDAMGPSRQTLPLRAEVVEPPPTATAISLELTWDTNGTDVDLHLTAPGGAPFLANDCYFGERQADWGVRGDSTDDCFLDRDDIDGLGPERMNLNRAAPGTYRVYVHYYADNRQGPSEASVDVNLAGTSVGTFRRRLSCNDMWFVGEIRWDGSVGTFVYVDVVERSPFGNCR